MYRIKEPKQFFSDFPSLSPRTVQVTSSATVAYNCIAWAAGDEKKWWWPSRYGYWPSSVLKECTIDSFVKAFETLGYTISSKKDHEANKEKLAIYTLDSKPTHAAKQKLNGKWTSKCGKNVDIEHALEELEGPCYGGVTLIMERPIQGSTQALPMLPPTKE